MVNKQIGPWFQTPDSHHRLFDGFRKVLEGIWALWSQPVSHILLSIPPISVLCHDYNSHDTMKWTLWMRDWWKERTSEVGIDVRNKNIQAGGQFRDNGCLHPDVVVVYLLGYYIVILDLPSSLSPKVWRLDPAWPSCLEISGTHPDSFTFGSPFRPSQFGGCLPMRG